jgi:hypothetical protein
MADFYPILARAVAGLSDPSPEARRAIYDRARTALVTQLRSLDPPLGEAEIMRERLSLDESVAKIEADYEPAPAAAELAMWPPEPAPPAEAPAPLPVEKQPEAAPLPLPVDRDFDDLPQDIPEPQPMRPRVAPPRQARVNPGHVRTAIVGTGVAIAVAAIAAAAYYVNKVKAPDMVARQHVEPAAQPAQPDSGGKINERVGEPGATTPARPGGTPTAPGQASDIAVAQRAILYIEVPENPQQPRAINGRVFWRLDSESAGQGRPVETIVRATIDIPEEGLGLDFTIRRNTDTAFPASHIIGLRFTSTGDPATQAVREVGVPQFKTDEGERGAPLSAINSALGDNLFVAALSNVPVEVERNLDLILNRSWIDVPVRFASGRRGIITFEKGFSGSQTLADAFNRWR